MSIIGPRLARSNQYDLIDERGLYGSNGIRPRVTSLAQINGRDIVATEDEARFDGEYVEKIDFLMDCKCFLGQLLVC